MHKLIKVFLSGKNYQAEGYYNTLDGTLKVLKGSVVVKKEPPSFKDDNLNVANLRANLMEKGTISNYEFVEDYIFDKPIHASGVIHANTQTDLKEWKTRDGITIKEFLSKENNLRKFKDFLSTFSTDVKKPDNDKVIKEFQEKFPLEEIRDLSLEEYDTTGNNQTLTYAIEHGTNEIFRGFLGVNRNKIFFNKPDGSYDTIDYLKNKYPDFSLEEIFEKYKEDLYTLIKEFDTSTYASGSTGAIPKNTNTIRSKLIMLYRPYELLHISSLTAFKKIFDYFGIDYDKDSDSIEMNIKLKTFLEKNLETDKDIVEFSRALWKFYEEYINKEEPVAPEPVVSLDDLFIDDKYINEIARVLKRKKNIIIQGVPGVGKTYCIKTIIKKYFDNLVEDSIEMIQFHQNYSYEEFVEGLRPQMNGVYEPEKGIFYDISIKARDNPSTSYFLIIDEINRGNLSKIFGELLLLIENDKRDNYIIKLPYSKEDFTVPENLYIIGTMNTADISLTIVDYALRRRFSFLTLQPAYNTNKFNKFLRNKMSLDDNRVDKINVAMSRVNELIEQTLGSEFLIGHSYFVADSDSFDDFDTWYKDIISYDILPLIEEYYFDDKDRVEKLKEILGIEYE